MDQFLSTLTGVAVSVILFFIGYRQTIGATKERAYAANSDLERIVLRRIVLEDDLPRETDISRLIKGKSIDHKVRPSDLLSVSQLLTLVYARIAESDLIDSNRRQELLNAITPVLVRSDARPLLDGEFDELNRFGRRRNQTRALVLAMGIVMSLMGGLLSVLLDNPSLLSNRSVLPDNIVLPTLGGLVAIAGLYFALRLRSFQEETVNRAGELSSYVAFED